MQQVLTCFLLVIAILGRILAALNVKTNSKQEGIEGGNTTLLCTYTPQTGADVTWSIDDGSDVYGRQLITRNRALDERYALVDQASLFLSNVRRSDEGAYVCSIYSSIELRSSTSTVQLNVLWIQKPQIELPSLQIVEGDVVDLVCSAVAEPVATYKWYRQGHEIALDHQRYVQSSKTGLLKIYYVGYADHTTFSCMASNVAGSKSSDELYLDVHYSPRFTLRKQGNSIRCVPYGNPTIDKVIYYINGSRQPDAIEVTIDERFCNTVTCFAENKAGTGNRTEIYCPKDLSPEKPDDLGNQTLVGVLTSVLIFLLLSAIVLIVFLALRPGPNFELEERYGELTLTDGGSSTV
ncbi:cell adhesion molecule 3-like isoform X2 [Anneissia japonica]|uniref:cell adhesion molecule 3-like isoform X2 n=1 Tax=Anneissia japonica TaxID=1529436 RepID=UPI001425B4D3|nr:cell adhesion molecule 3-like isoform X2 [Anneissia japonica]